MWLEGGGYRGVVIGLWLKALDWSEHYAAHDGGACRHP